MRKLLALVGTLGLLAAVGCHGDRPAYEVYPQGQNRAVYVYHHDEAPPLPAIFDHACEGQGWKLLGGTPRDGEMPPEIGDRDVGEAAGDLEHYLLECGR
jgi:hypothetical protein